MTEQYTFGIELELDTTDQDGKRKNIQPALEGLEGENWESCPEIHPQTLELKTSGAHTLDEGLRAINSALETTVENIDGILYPFGTLPHSFPRKEYDEFERFIREHPDEYYKYLCFTRDGSVIRNLDVCGAQFHVGHENPEVLLRRYNYLRWLIPLFAGLSTSSPVRIANFNGYYSERARAKTKLIKTGVPPVITSQENLKALLTPPPDVEDSPSPGYYLMRFPRLDLGTTEMCASDMTPDVRILTALSDIYHRICRKIDQTRETDMPEDIFGAKRFQLSPESSTFINSNLETINRTNKSTKDHYIGLGDTYIPFHKWVENVLRFISDTPSGLKFEGFSSEEEIRKTLEDGTVAERIIQELTQEGIINPGKTFGSRNKISKKRMPEVYAIYQKLTAKCLRDGLDSLR